MSTKSYDEAGFPGPRYLSISDSERLLDQLPREVRAVVALSRFAGLRPGEALRLHWSDIDLEAGTITLRVTGQEDPTVARHRSFTRLRLGRELRRELMDHKARIADRTLLRDEVLVFATRSGKPLRPHALAYAIRVAGLAAGLSRWDGKPPGLHDLRHSFIADSWRAAQKGKTK
jgi:integrase